MAGAGNINSKLIEDYRNVVANEILQNEIIVDVLGNGGYTMKNADELIWKRLFPLEFDPETVTETESYIFFDIDEVVSAIDTYTTLTLYFWVLTHKSIVRYTGDVPSSANRLRNDILCRELKKTFAPESNLGISRNKLVYNKIYSQSSAKYTGRVLAFNITDFSDKPRYDLSGARRKKGI